MEQAQDFLEESNILLDVVRDLDDPDFSRKTLFKNWTINEILIHLPQLRTFEFLL